MKKQIGERIRELRRKAGYTQSMLAQKLGISPSAIGMYEQGRREPDNETVVRLSHIFGITADYLLGNTTAEKTTGVDISEIFEEFTGKLSTQPGLMFDGVPLDDDDRMKIIDAVRVVAAIAQQQYKRTPGKT